MGADWSKPDLNSLKTNFPGEIRAIAESAAKMDFSADTNVPSNVIRYNSTKAALERYNGSTWSRLFPAAGTVQMYMGTTAPTGYLLLNGSTIGNAASGGTALASADAEDLFTFLWTNLANSEAAVSGGRGASAAADFAANKTIALPDMRQRFALGKAAAGTGSTLGGTGGSIDHTHSVPAHYHGMGTGADLNITASGAHTHPQSVSNVGGGALRASPYNINMQADTTDQIGTSSSTHTHSSGSFAGSIGLVTGGVDGNAAMTSGTNNPPFITVNYIIKI